MKKNLQRILLAVVLFVGGSSAISAAGFTKGGNYIGPHIGYGSYGMILGLWYEHGVHQYVGIGAEGDFTWWSYPYTSEKYNVLGTRLMVTVAGHIPINQVPNLDLFVKIGLGFGMAVWPSSYNPYGKDGAYVHPYFAWDVIFGLRYFFNDKIGVRIETGYPSWIKAGVDFKI